MAAFGIPLQVKQPDIASPLEVYTAAAQLGQLQQQRQLHAQQIQENEVKLQEMRENQADQQKLAALYTQHNGDMPKVIAAAPAYGIRPKTVEALQLQHQQGLQRAAQTDELELKNGKEHNARMRGRIAAIMAAPPDAQPAAWSQQRADAIKAGDIDEAHAPADYPGLDSLKFMDATLRTGDDYFEHGIKVNAEARAAAKAKEDADKAAREDKLAPLKEEEQRSKTAKETTAAAAQELSNAASQPEWDAALKKYPTAIGTFGPMYSQSAQKKAKNLAMTAYQQGELGTAAQRAEDAQTRIDQAQQRIDQGWERLNKSGAEKPATKGQFATVEGKKQKSIADSKKQLDKELGLARAGQDAEAEDEAWKNHIERLQDAQTGYEQELSALSGNSVDHNPWADKLKPPSETKPAATPKPKAPGIIERVKSAVSGAKPEQTPSVKYTVGQKVKLKNGKVVTITSINGDQFEYE